MLWGKGVFGEWPSRTIIPFSPPPPLVLACSQERLLSDPTLSYSDYQRLMWALSRIDYVPPRSWQREFIDLSVPLLSRWVVCNGHG